VRLGVNVSFRKIRTEFHRLTADGLFVGIALSLTLITAGCQTDQQVADVKPLTKCDAVARLLSSPSATAGQTAMALEVGRNSGCFGQAQPQTVLVR
jgi:hypothetical protein